MQSSSKVSARKPVCGESADHSTHGSKLQPKLTGKKCSESFFFHKHGVMGSWFNNVLTQSLGILGQPIQNFTEPLLRQIFEHQELLRALVPASQPLESHSGFATRPFRLLIETFFRLILSRLIEFFRVFSSLQNDYNSPLELARMLTNDSVTC